MAWQFLESMILSNQWKLSDYTSGNLFKIIHTCSFPPEFAWRYKGLIGQTLNDSDTGNLQLFGEIQQLYFDPPNQFILFDPLNNIDLRRIACKGYYGNTTFSWIAQIYVWDAIIYHPSNLDSTTLIESSQEQNILLNQQQALINGIIQQNAQIINALSSLPFSNTNANGNGSGGNNNGNGNPNLGI